MPLYKIAVSWEMCGEVEILANSFEEAWNIVDKDPDTVPLPEGEYVDASFYGDYEMSKFLNNIKINEETEEETPD